MNALRVTDRLTYKSEHQRDSCSIKIQGLDQNQCLSPEEPFQKQFRLPAGILDIGVVSEYARRVTQEHELYLYDREKRELVQAWSITVLPNNPKMTAIFERKCIFGTEYTYRVFYQSLDIEFQTLTFKSTNPEVMEVTIRPPSPRART